MDVGVGYCPLITGGEAWDCGSGTGYASPIEHNPEGGFLLPPCGIVCRLAACPGGICAVSIRGKSYSSPSFHASGGFYRRVGLREAREPCLTDENLFARSVHPLSCRRCRTRWEVSLRRLQNPLLDQERGLT